GSKFRAPHSRQQECRHFAHKQLPLARPPSSLAERHIRNKTAAREMSSSKMFPLRRLRLEPRGATAFARILFISMLALSLSGAAAAAASCDASTLPSYQHMQDLTGQGFILHWSLATPTRLDIALEAKPGSGAENGWISVGWSADGKMAPADAVIGNLPGVAVGAYDISGYDGTTIVSSTSFKISGGLLISANGRSTIIK
ncbi:unnamed protein product, partial [Closterium sp. NIES-54]